MTIIIDGVSFDAPLVDLEETCNFLDKYAERTQDGKLKRELIGVYFNQSIKFGDMSAAVHAALWEKLTEPVEFHEVTVPDTDGVDFTFDAYFANVKRRIKKWKASTTLWRELTVSFIAQEPARTPE